MLRVVDFVLQLLRVATDSSPSESTGRRFLRLFPTFSVAAVAERVLLRRALRVDVVSGSLLLRLLVRHHFVVFLVVFGFGSIATDISRKVCFTLTRTSIWSTQSIHGVS